MTQISQIREKTEISDFIKGCLHPKGGLMFSVIQKREIADGVQKVLRATGHPELQAGEIDFRLHVEGAEAWSYADIRNNGRVPTPSVNPHNELQDDSRIDG